MGRGSSKAGGGAGGGKAGGGRITTVYDTKTKQQVQVNVKEPVVQLDSGKSYRVLAIQKRSMGGEEKEYAVADWYYNGQWHPVKNPGIEREVAQKYLSSQATTNTPTAKATTSTTKKATSTSKTAATKATPTAAKKAASSLIKDATNTKGKLSAKGKTTEFINPKTGEKMRVNIAGATKQKLVTNSKTKATSKASQKSYMVTITNLATGAKDTMNIQSLPALRSYIYGLTGIS